MVAALLPGGWLLLEEPDFFPVYTSTSQIYVDFMYGLALKGPSSGVHRAIRLAEQSLGTHVISWHISAGR
jgi:hypothetical protein